jgi:hypothetical protein
MERSETRPCIDRQRDHDHRRDRVGISLLKARFDAVLEAKEAVLGNEQHAVFAYRQSLVDLAACAELMAEKMRAPTFPR